MFVESKTAKGIYTVPIESRLLSNRSVFLTDEITHESVIEIVKQVMYLRSENDTEPIDLFLSTSGGEINAGLILYDMLTGMKQTPVRIICMGKAFSMGAVLLAAGQKGMRCVMPHSKVMIHEPLIQGGISGSTTSIQSIAESMVETRKLINGIMSRHTGKTLKQIEKATSYDHYFSAKEAVAFGIADNIVTFEELFRKENDYEYVQE